MPANPLSLLSSASCHLTGLVHSCALSCTLVCSSSQDTDKKILKADLQVCCIQLKYVANQEFDVVFVLLDLGLDLLYIFFGNAVLPAEQKRESDVTKGKTNASARRGW